MFTGVGEERIEAALSEAALAVFVEVAEEFSGIFCQFDYFYGGLS